MSADIDPYGQWPDAGSSVRGLRSGKRPNHPAYIFHTRYVAVEPGRATFTVRFAGLRATGGRLILRLQSTRPERHGRVERRVRIDIPAGTPADVETMVAFDARIDRQYAIHARTIDGIDVAAESVAVTLDRPLHGTTLPRAAASLVARVRAAASRPSPRDGRLRSLRTLGLVSGARASIAEPVSQMVTGRQFGEPAYRRLAAMIGQEPTTHRKQWEFVYILAVLDRFGHLAPGRRGLGFGTGTEPLPSVFASCGVAVTATDAPLDDQVQTGWAATNQHAGGLEAVYDPRFVAREAFDRLTRFRVVDMNRIPADLRGFDFCWSACAFEHLGSIAAGVAFVEQSLDTLRPGGIAVHTTELNLSSNGATVDNGATVLFRWRDFERLAVRLRRRGHRVLPICYDAGDQPTDLYVDVPPYAHDVHLKLLLVEYVTTSFGIAVVKDGLA